MTFFARRSIIRLEKESKLSIRSRKGYVVKNRLEELRKQRGIKQEDLATALEVSRQTIGSLENGRYNPSIMLAFKIAMVLSNEALKKFLFMRRKVNEA